MKQFDYAICVVRSWLKSIGANGAARQNRPARFAAYLGPRGAMLALLILFSLALLAACGSGRGEDDSIAAAAGDNSTTDALNSEPISAAQHREESAPAPAPIGTVRYYESSVTLPVYPFEKYQSDAVDPDTNWPYKVFDYERFETEAPTPTERRFRTIVLENAFLELTILPALGGRLWQVVHKPTGNRMFYQNTVVKPTRWGPGNQRGWLGLGGLEWNIPVIEHGYEWGTEWGVLPLQHSPELASVTLFTPQDGRPLNASITISLLAGAASFTVEPSISNLSDDAVTFDYWQTAMLAPGQRNSPSAQLHFVLPGQQMMVHSTNDPALPQPGELFTWPQYDGRDLSRLGNWNQYLGFFEYPAAHGPFVGVYDGASDAGAVRFYPADVARGSKVFSPGWNDALPPSNYTDDDSSYVELHGGLAPSFFEHYTLPQGGLVNWREVWYPVVGIGDLSYANEAAALSVKASASAADAIQVGFYPTRPMDGALIVTLAHADVSRTPLEASPEHPFVDELALPQPVDLTAADPALEIRFEDAAGRVLLLYQP
ncbi:MAG: DUF5107 domain-containing protein [Caldilineaceae bacterium]